MSPALPPPYPLKAQMALKLDLTLNLAGLAQGLIQFTSENVQGQRIYTTPPGQDLIKSCFNSTFKMCINELRLYFYIEVKIVIKLIQSAHNIPMGC